MLKKIKFYLKRSRITSKLYFSLREKKRIYFNRRNSKFLHQNGLEALMVLQKVLKRLNIEFFLDASTLLGAIREKNFIKGDNDLGIGINFKDYSSVIEKELEKNGIKLVKDYTIDNKEYGLQQTYIYKKVEIDIMYHKIDETKSETKSHCFIDNLEDIETYKIKEYTFPFTGLTTITFLGKVFKIPKEPEKYLEAIYGKDFMTPNPKWQMSDEKNGIILDNKVGYCRKYKK